MLSLYEILRAGKTGISPSFWATSAARAFFSESFEPTEESDYIHDGGHIIYYQGTSQRPEIPQFLGTSQVKSIGADAFLGRDIKAVKIPEGTEVIY